MTEFTSKEITFLESMEEARIATSHNDIPHVKPVSFVFHRDAILVATDYKTRTYENIKVNSNSGIVVDIYKHGAHKAVCVQGPVEIIENGPDFEEYYKIFYKKFEWVRKDPWKENEAPFLRINPKNKISWGIN
ncbi:pyridoxamine 5'-phosphate oxidase family protein [Nitrosopumilus sp.]|uniref:pyridoxamine 5'-phosphate oxidase family protein n=1 Tax=Nitrosopumilus sp. TaxID=2024843 RepID=UPI0026195017|nr:pyridoxamine 5'-phosphate oxidase family protein [Nitrosopumilus sp.]